MSVYERKLTSEGPVFSFHAFIFPFEWKYKHKSGELFEDQVNIQDILNKMLGDTRWERRTSWLDAESLVQFNETAYFYPFVHPVLYDSGKNDKTIQVHYYYNVPEDAEYVIQLPDGTVYRLRIDDITLSYYDTGAGYLAFHLLNKDAAQSAPDDVLKINFFGRRVYPPFMGTDMSKVGKQAFFTDDDWEIGLKRTIEEGKELARSIRLEQNGQAWVVENFATWLKEQYLRRPPDLIAQLLPVSLASTVRVEPILDDRMLVVSWYGNDLLAKEVKGKKPETNYEQNDWWYKYVFVDKEWPTCANKVMQADLIKKATYSRWVENGTFYGVSRYSFMALTGEMSNGFFPKLLFTHTQTLYYKLVSLCVVQRACLLRFSEEITAISQLETSRGQIGKRIGSLYKQYLRFVNKIYFREVTAQEQGIELYNMLQMQMDIPNQVAALQQEMEQLYQYALIVDEDQRNDKLDILTYIGAFFVVPSFIGTYFGIADYDLSEHWMWISVFSLLAAGLAFFTIRTTGRMRNLLLAALVLLMLGIIFLFPYFKAPWG